MFNYVVENRDARETSTKVLHSPERQSKFVTLFRRIFMLIKEVTHAWGLFYQYELTLTPAWISNYNPYKVWDEITNPFLNFNVATVVV